MSKTNALHGWLILDKPSGITSAHAVNKVKRLLKPAKIGHAGTLDPLASGVLPLALGEATKTVGYMMDTSKAYAFTVCWGQATDTDDSQGSVIQQSDVRPTQEQIEAHLPQFIGDVAQTPPNYSAIKVAGQRAYDMAREGQELSLESRVIHIDSLELQQHDSNSSTFICHCGKGTYIRSIARDMGQKLGCLGHVTMLRRLKVGKFSENEAISLEKLEEMVHKGGDFLHPVESPLDDILAIDIDSTNADRVRCGQTVSLPQVSDNETILLRYDGKLLAIASARLGVIKSKRVFNLP